VERPPEHDRYNGLMVSVHHLENTEREAVLEQLSAALATREDVIFAYAYGSFLLQDGFRDIDVSVWTDSHAGERIDVEVANQLTRLVRFPVDVRVVNRAPVAFLFHVLRGRRLVVTDERLLSDLIERTARTCHDRAPLIRRAAREAFAA
jgi:predicted nucleotidyltransferase